MVQYLHFRILKFPLMMCIVMFFLGLRLGPEFGGGFNLLDGHLVQFWTSSGSSCDTKMVLVSPNLTMFSEALEQRLR